MRGRKAAGYASEYATLNSAIRGGELEIGDRNIEVRIIPVVSHTHTNHNFLSSIYFHWIQYHTDFLRSNSQMCGRKALFVCMARPAIVWLGSHVRPRPRTRSKARGAFFQTDCALLIERPENLSVVCKRYVPRSQHCWHWWRGKSWMCIIANRTCIHASFSNSRCSTTIIMVDLSHLPA